MKELPCKLLLKNNSDSKPFTKLYKRINSTMSYEKGQKVKSLRVENPQARPIIARVNQTC